MKYRVMMTTTASMFVEVEADDAEQAEEVALAEHSHPSICAQCSGWGKDYSIDLGEWDTEPDVPAEPVED